MEKTPEQLEHFEHAQHASQRGSFDRRVAMTMAIVAALLATVTMLGHRAHNETLRLQGEANRLQTEADVLHTRAADQWGFFQAKNIRRHEYQAFSNLLKVLAPAAGKEAEHAKQIQFWEAKVKEYDALDDRKNENSEDKEQEAQRSRFTAPDVAGGGEDTEKKSLRTIRRDAEQLEADAREKQHLAEQSLRQSQHYHHRGFWLDMAELAVELGLVLCSLAVLTKRSPFWIGGMISAGAGAVIALVAYLAS